jgi:3-oxoadipate enol-lactonase
MTSGTFNTSDGCSIAFNLRGSGPRIALIHSLGLNSSLWNEVADLLSPEAQVLTYDCRGHGRSGRVAETFTTALFASDLFELLDHVGWPAPVVAGCSMGGCVAQNFGALFPFRTRALGLIDTTAWYGPDAVEQWAQRAAAPREKGFKALMDFQLSRWFSDTFRAREPKKVQALVDVYVSNDLDAYAKACAMLGAADLRPYQHCLTMPVAIVVGDQDYATPIEHSRQMHAAIPHSTLTIIPGARHLTPVECPHEIAAALAKLL